MLFKSNKTISNSAVFLVLLSLTACSVSMRIPERSDRQSVHLKTDILNKDYRIGLVSLYFRAAYLDDNKLSAALSGSYEALKHYYPDCLPLIGEQYINSLSQNTHLNLISGDAITQQQAYVDLEPTRMLYVTANYPGYKVLLYSENEKLAKLARDLKLNAVMVVHIYPQSYPIKDGITIFTHQYIKVVDQKARVIMSSHIGMQSAYYMIFPYDLNKTSKLMLDSLKLGLRELQQRMDSQYQG